MKKATKITIVASVVLLLVLFVAVATWLVWAISLPKETDDPLLRTELEKVYATYLHSISTEDPAMLRSVLTAHRVQEFSSVFEQNKMRFPDDYFRVMKKVGPKLPTVENLRYVGLTKSDKYTNLIYYGSLIGFLRCEIAEPRFLIIQFEKESNAWKYSVIMDVPNIIPHLEERLKKHQLYFLKFEPFKAEKLELAPPKN